MSGPGTYNWTIYQGATNKLPLTYKDADGKPIDLTDYSARMQVRRLHSSVEVLLCLDSSTGSGIVLGGKAGTIEIRIEADKAALLNFSQGVYDFELINPEGEVERLIEGIVKLSPEVTRETEA